MLLMKHFRAILAQKGMKDKDLVSFNAHIPRVIPRNAKNTFICGGLAIHNLDVLEHPCRHVRLPGLEPGTAGSKPAVISISPQTQNSLILAGNRAIFILEEPIITHCGYGLVVERVLAKDEIGVRFSVSAQSQ